MGWQIFLSRKGWHIARVIDKQLQRMPLYFPTIEDARKELENLNANQI